MTVGIYPCHPGLALEEMEKFEESKSDSATKQPEANVENPANILKNLSFGGDNHPCQVFGRVFGVEVLERCYRDARFVFDTVR